MGHDTGNFRAWMPGGMYRVDGTGPMTGPRHLQLVSDLDNILEEGDFDFERFNRENGGWDETIKQAVAAFRRPPYEASPGLEERSNAHIKSVQTQLQPVFDKMRSLGYTISELAG